MFNWFKKVSQDTKHLKEIQRPKQQVIRINLTGYTAKQLVILKQLADGDIDDLSGDFFITGEYKNGDNADEAE